jgi:hypothetical protein
MVPGAGSGIFAFNPIECTVQNTVALWPAIFNDDLKLADFVAKVSVRLARFRKSSFNYTEWEVTHETHIANPKNAMIEGYVIEKHSS